MGDREVRWLHRELPDLVRRGIVPAPVAARLREHYGEPAPLVRSSTHGLGVFTVLGATLIGLGVILLLAHNWQELSRSARAALVFTMLLGTQALGGIALLSRRGSVAWTESTSGLLALAVGASLALISQTYQLPGEPRGLILVWMLLIAPLPYLFGAALPAIGYWVGITVWVLMDPSHPSSLPLWAMLAAIALPDLLRPGRFRELSARNSLQAWVAALCLSLGLLALFASESGAVWALFAPALGAAMVAASRLADERDLPQLGLPFRFLGTLGLGWLVVVMSFGVWEGLPLWPTEPAELWRARIAVGLALLLVGFALPWTWREVRARRWHRALLLALPAPFALALGAAEAGEEVVSVLLVNAYGLGLALAAVLAGLRAGRIATSNAGMLLLAALITARFVDADWSFLVRGLVFIGLGGAFLGLNLRLRARLQREGS